jgi:hypothetical protein
MKSKLLIILLIMISSGIYAQENFTAKSELNFSSVPSYNNRFIAGLGLEKTFPVNSENMTDTKYYFEFSTGVIFHIKKPFYLHTGGDIAFGKREQRLYLNILPAVELNFFKNELLIQLGTGPATILYFTTPEGGMLIGAAIMLRPEYKLSKKFATAIELKHYNFFRESTGKLIFTGNLCFTYYY